MSLSNEQYFKEQLRETQTERNCLRREAYDMARRIWVNMMVLCPEAWDSLDALEKFGAQFDMERRTDAELNRAWYKENKTLLKARRTGNPKPERDALVQKCEELQKSLDELHGAEFVDRNYTALKERAEKAEQIVEHLTNAIEELNDLAGLGEEE